MRSLFSIYIFLVTVGFTFTHYSQAEISLKNLGYKDNSPIPTNIKLDVIATKKSVGSCGGRSFSDEASLVGCQKNLEIKQAMFQRVLYSPFTKFSSNKPHVGIPSSNLTYR